MIPLTRTTKWMGSLVLAGAISSLAAPPTAHADEIAYLIAVTVRPGYNFPNPDAALQYGRTVCQRVAQGVSYTDNISSIKADLSTDDAYQAAYLINQAVDNLCPALIWQLRNSAAHYRGGPN